MLKGNRLAEKGKHEDALQFSKRELANAAWHHIAIRYDSVAAVVDFFVDGKLVESDSYSIAFPVRLTTVSIGEFRENKQIHRYLVESSRFPQGQLRDAKLFARALLAEEVHQMCAAHCNDVAPFPVPEDVQRSDGRGQEYEDAELEAALALSLSALSRGGTDALEETGLGAPMKEHQQMLEQVMAMGFDEASASSALEATGWTGVEAAIGVLFG
jgi:hypothetical protein